MSLELFAKLIATENITLQRGNYHTASFDLVTRTVFIPKFVDMTDDEELCLTFHEVGHALYSDELLLEEVVKANSNSTYKQYLNVVEDARIERKMKERYPGSKKVFFDGYTRMTARDFFGTKKRDVNTYNFIDRINVWAKVGDRSNVKFSDEEMRLVNKLKKIQTSADSISLTKEIYKFAQAVKKTPTPKAKTKPEEIEEDQDEVGDQTEEQQPETETDETEESSEDEPGEDSQGDAAGDPKSEGDVSSESEARSDIVGALLVNELGVPEDEECGTVGDGHADVLTELIADSVVRVVVIADPDGVTLMRGVRVGATEAVTAALWPVD